MNGTLQPTTRQSSTATHRCPHCDQTIISLTASWHYKLECPVLLDNINNINNITHNTQEGQRVLT